MPTDFGGHLSFNGEVENANFPKLRIIRKNKGSENVFFVKFVLN